jgi:hypothetical protein
VAQLQTEIERYRHQGEVALLGDFNAHTSTLDDRGMGGDGVFDEMGTMGQAGAGGSTPTAPPRVNVDRTPPGDEGRLLVDLCVATKCLIMNGRPRGTSKQLLRLSAGMARCLLWLIMGLCQGVPACPALCRASQVTAL